ncbi:MAG: hypothetical protein ABJB74_14680 [Gemmatimonas sp.]
MSTRARFIRTLAFTTFAATVALLPNLASAQLGKLKKAATDAAKEKAGTKSETPAPASANFVITADRLAAVMTVMDASMEKAAKDAAAKAVVTDYNTKHKAYEKCIETQMQTLAGKAPSVDGMQKAAAESQKTGALSQRMLAAQRANKYREVVALNDTMQIMSLRPTLIMYGLETKCGGPVYMPLAIVDDNAAKMASANGSQSNNIANEVTVSPSARAGMTTQQFGMVRERAALWALQQTNNAPADNNKYSVFTADEQAVLSAQGAKLKKWAPIFKESPATWSGWGDIKAW